MSSSETPEARALARRWFYPYRLPSGAIVPTYGDGELDAIHATRSAMLDAFLAEAFSGDRAALTAVDIACHQGWFSVQLARAGFGQVTAFDPRDEHVADTGLISNLLGLTAIDCFEADIHALPEERRTMADLVLCFGLIYHLENPVGALRVARSLTRRACVIETQVAPGLGGWMDYGSYEFVRPIKGSFALIDETGETHGPEASTTGICLVPSLEGLLWVLRSVGFDRTEVLPVPADGYEQLRHHKRVMVAAFVDP